MHLFLTRVEDQNHTQINIQLEELELIKQKHSKFKTDGLAQVYVEARKCQDIREVMILCVRRLD
jgi:hypothetical protein